MTLSEVQYDVAKKTLELEIEPSQGATYQTQFIGTLRGFDDATQPVLGKDGQPLKDKNGQPARSHTALFGRRGPDSGDGGRPQAAV